MKKRMFTAVAAITVSVSTLSLSAFSSEAFGLDNATTDFYNELKEYNFFQVDYSTLRCNLTDGTFRGIKQDEFYLARLDRRYEMIGLTDQPDRIYIDNNEGFTEEDAAALVQEYNKINDSANFEIELWESGADENKKSDRYLITSAAGDITSVEAKDICNFMKEKGFADQCTYWNDTKQITNSHIYGDYLMRYHLDTDDITALGNYIKENNCDWTIRSSPDDSDTFVIPNYTVTIEDQMEIVNQIYDDLGFTINWIMLMDTNQVHDGVDVLGFIDGDANKDGELSLADAITVMQAVGNPDQYALDAQQKFNADVYGNGDGITNMDALTIQRRLLGLE